jgi:hypothetical protein
VYLYAPFSKRIKTGEEGLRVVFQAVVSPITKPRMGCHERERKRDPEAL